MEARFTTRQAAELGHVVYSTFAFMRANGVVTPSVRVGGGQGLANIFSFGDVVALRSLSELRAVPSTFEALRGVAAFWKKPEMRALIAASEKAAWAGTPLPKKRMLVITSAGKVALVGNSKLCDLIKTHDSAVLHIVDVSRLVGEVLVEASELRLLRVHVEPEASGRVPRGSLKKKSPVLGKSRGEKNQPAYPMLLLEALEQYGGKKNRGDK